MSRRGIICITACLVRKDKYNIIFSHICIPLDKICKYASFSFCYLQLFQLIYNYYLKYFVNVFGHFTFVYILSTLSFIVCKSNQEASIFTLLMEIYPI